jgi:hypothetical protein
MNQKGSRSAAFWIKCPGNLQRFGFFSWHFLGIADVFGAVGFSSAVAADNGRLVCEGFDAFIVILGL